MAVGATTTEKLPASMWPYYGIPRATSMLNPHIFILTVGPIVMFAWENAQIVRRRDEKLQKSKRRYDQLKKAALVNEDPAALGNGRAGAKRNQQSKGKDADAPAAKRPAPGAANGKQQKGKGKPQKKLAASADGQTGEGASPQAAGDKQNKGKTTQQQPPAKKREVAPKAASAKPSGRQQDERTARGGKRPAYQKESALTSLDGLDQGPASKKTPSRRERKSKVKRQDEGGDQYIVACCNASIPSHLFYSSPFALKTFQTERQFDDMVDKYRRKLESTEQAEKSHRWFDDA